jgi:adenine-specific DNA methylase
MRYLGNKTKLLPAIADVLANQKLESGRALDGFSGTGAVGAILKVRGFEVSSCDLLSSSYVFQRALIQNNTYPEFEGLVDDRWFQSFRTGELELLRRELQQMALVIGDVIKERA